MSKVRVRFAPSPTGYLHVGGARTAIFNWLFAHRQSGVFLLRIEDTDRARSSQEVVRVILEAMDWLGMTPDEGPYFQSRRQERHVADAQHLLEKQKAYRCFCDPEQLRRDREEAERAGRSPAHPHPCLALSPEESSRRADAGEPFALRFHVPEGEIRWNDLVHGPTAFEAEAVEDFVLLRSDGSPTYMMSVVSDDLSMGITHVIRGDDHLSNTPKQILLFRALGHEPPLFAHLPMILGDDRKRLSKRHGAVSVLEYREQGYLPEAMFNFLALLGWSPGDDREKMSRHELVAAFDFGGVGKSAAVFDLKKLQWLNGAYLREMDPDELESQVRPFLERAGLWSDDLTGSRREWFRKVLAVLQPRCRTLAEFAEEGRFFLDPTEEFPYDPKATKKHLKGNALEQRLRALRRRLEEVEAWEAGSLEVALRSLAEELGVSAGKLIHPTRVALTGKGASPGIFDVLELLGRERSLSRMDRLIASLNGRPGPA